MTLDPALTGVVADRVRVLALAGHAGEATKLGEPALRAARGDEHAELCLALARAALADGRWEDAARCVERADRPDDAAAVAIAADAAFGAGDPIRAAALAARAVSLAETRRATRRAVRRAGGHRALRSRDGPRPRPPRRSAAPRRSPPRTDSTRRTSVR